MAVLVLARGALRMLDKKDFSIYQKRRKALIEQAKKNNHHGNSGIILLSGAFEQERVSFRQASSFHYLTGINEPAAVLCLHLDGRQVLYLPNFGNEREKWVSVGISAQSNPQDFGFDEIKHLSEPVKGYSYSPCFAEEKYQHLLSDVKEIVKDDGTILMPVSFAGEPLENVQMFREIERVVPELETKKNDVLPVVHHLRRFKDESEIALIQRAIDITAAAQQKAAREISAGVFENEVQASIEYIYTKNGASQAFPSIVATGKNTTILHYTDRNQKINDGDLVLVDIGAEYNCYAADITRTYPASGKFTERQKEVYELVLATQKHIEELAKPGMYLKNPKQPEISLHHLAVKFLEEKGYANYFPHGIGHYLGLDVHDVGDYTTPLAPGDVFTIEPGIYIPDEKLGVRIEDDYLMTADGAQCLSKAIRKSVAEIEALMS